jgi:hypothetical protein
MRELKHSFYRSAIAISTTSLATFLLMFNVGALAELSY